MKTDGEYTEQMFGKNQTPRAGFEPTTLQKYITLVLLYV